MVSEHVIAVDPSLPDSSAVTSRPMDSSRLLLGLMTLFRRAEASCHNIATPDGMGSVISRTVLRSLMSALHFRDVATVCHSRRVALLSVGIAQYLGWDPRQQKVLEVAALLHDIGKIGVPDAILRKPAKLNADEWEKMKLHPVHGQKILRNISFLEGAARVVGQHHERWDGAGYPYGLRGEEIDIGARIFAVIDAFDAMVSDRVYRRGRSYELAIEELERCAGSQFDPMIVAAFKSIPRDDWELLRERSLMEKNEIHSFQSVVADLVYSAEELEFVH